MHHETRRIDDLRRSDEPYVDAIPKADHRPVGFVVAPPAGTDVRAGLEDVARPGLRFRAISGHDVGRVRDADRFECVDIIEVENLAYVGNRIGGKRPCRSDRRWLSYSAKTSRRDCSVEANVFGVTFPRRLTKRDLSSVRI